MKPIVKHLRTFFLSVFVLALLVPAAFSSDASSDFNAWRDSMIEDAITAAPPSVTNDATIYAWDKAGHFHLLRPGTGVHNCVASGAFSNRIGQPRLPFPDPMCFDPNAWAFFKAIWSEKNPMKPSKPYPTAPGLVWMLAGMGVPDGMVRKGSSSDAQFKVDSNGKKIAQLSPHIMIMPLPVAGKSSTMPFNYDPETPSQTWLMAAGTAIEHVMLHVTKEDVKAMMSH